MLLCKLLLLLSLVPSLCQSIAIDLSGENRYSQRLDNYEPLDYNTNEVIRQHNLIKLTGESFGPWGQQFLGETSRQISFSFDAFGTEFNLRIKPDASALHPSVEMNVIGIGGKEKSRYDPTTLYTGIVLGDPESLVHGHVLQSGVFDGIIHAFNNTFHIEPAKRFISDPSFHSVLYRYSDVRQELRNVTWCDNDKHLDKLREEYWTSKTQESVEQPVLNSIHSEGRRLKRAENFLDTPICPVYLAADHTFYQSVGGSDETQTINELVTHLNEANQIYERTDFNGDGDRDNVAFTVARIDVFTDPNAPDYLFGNKQFTSSSDYLDTWSRYDQDSFCLAMLFGYRELDDGVLGLAWVAGTNQVGGICQKRIRLNTGFRNLNTAIVTLLNFGQLQPRAVSVITVAHEFGHNFGSPHDPLEDSTCSPGAFGGTVGNFLMYARATDGTLSNNDKFSSCSISSITPVLVARSPMCFLSTTAVCGNGLVEEGEDCDCGDVTSCQDPCCVPSGSGDQSCKFVPNAECTQDLSTGSVCCNSSCRFVPPEQMKVCQPNSVCSSESLCGGNSSTCPAPVNEPDGLNCSASQTCLGGECVGSICAGTVNTKECQCTDKDRLCDLCCRKENDVSTCVAIETLGNFGRLYREAGRSCQNFEGYCSSDSPPKCELVNNNNILDSLLDLFSLESVLLFKDWLAQYWYIPIIIVIVIIVLAILLHFTYRRKKDDIKDLARSTMRRGGANKAKGRRQGSHRIQKMMPQQALTRLKRLFPTVDVDILKEIMVNSKSEEKAVERLLDAGFPLYKVDTN